MIVRIHQLPSYLSASSSSPFPSSSLHSPPLTCSPPILLPPFLTSHPPSHLPSHLPSSIVDEALAREKARKLKARQIRGARSHPHCTLSSHPSHPHTSTLHTSQPHFSLLPPPSLISCVSTTSVQPCFKFFLIQFYQLYQVFLVSVSTSPFC